VLRPYKGVLDVEVWVGLNLNPAIWEAIAGTGWRSSVVVSIDWVDVDQGREVKDEAAVMT
jgi:hypothetical protein